MFGKRKLEKQLSKLSLEQGDLIVLRTNKGFRKWIDILQVIIRRLKIYKNVDVTALVLPEDVRFGKISEKEMNNAGWFKQDKEEVKRILEDNEMLHEWNDGIKKLHVEDALRAYDIQEELKEKIRKFESGEG
jgi:hypothetical protein